MKKLLFSVLLLLMTAIGVVAQETLTVNNGTATSSYVPIYGLYVDSYLKCEFVIPESELEDMTNGTISAMKFYLSSPANAAWSGANFQVFMKEFDATTISAYSGTEGATIVYEGSLDGTSSELDVSFSTDYTYSGGNLLVGVYNTVKGTYKSASFYGVSATGACVQGYNSSSLSSVSASQRDFLPQTTFTYTPGAAPSCPKVNNLAANNLTSSSADITWEAGGTETAWVLKYGTTGFDVETEGTPEDISTNPAFQITGLSANTSYDAYVKAVCGVSDESAWKKVTFRTECGIENVPYTENFESFGAGTVPSCWDNSASTTSTIGSSPSYVWGVYSYNDNKMLRMYNYYVNSGTALINSPSISIPTDGVYQLVFEYSHTASCGAFDVKISEDGGSSFVVLGSYAKVGTSTSYSDPGTFTEVEPVSLAAYAGKTVMLQFYANADYSSGAIFVDNISIALAPSCMKPTALSSSNVTARTADLSWTAGGTETAWHICLDGDEDHLIDADSNPFTLTGLTPEHAYTVKVRANCGGDVSAWTNNISFTTTVSCPVPTAFTYSNISNTSATVSWTAGDSEGVWNFKYKKTADDEWTEVNGLTSSSYTITGLTGATAYSVQVQADCESDGTSTWMSGSFTTAYEIPFLEEFSTVIPADWSQKSGLLSNVMGGTALTSGSGWNFGTNNGVFDNHARANIYGSSCNKWLLTPIIAMDANVQLTFDLALTAYSGTMAAAATNGTDDKFVVLISTNGGETWTILRQYDNAGSEYVYNNIPVAGEEVAINLSSYGSDNVIIAFYGESTTSNADNNLHVDNVRLDYIPNCVRPTGLIASNVNSSEATLSWTAGADETAWQICIGGDEDNLISVEENPNYVMSGLTAATTYAVKVRANCGGSDGVSEWTSEYEFTTEICDAIDMCQIRFDLTDSYGDSWNGNAIKVTDVATGIVLGTFANENLNGTTGSGENELNTLYLAVCNGREIEFSWISGSYPTETSYVVYDAIGTEIFSGSGSLTTTTHTITCPSCYAPTALTASSVGASTATLTWTAGRWEENWILQYGTDDTFAENTEVEISTTPTANLTGLDATTTYYVRVKSDCGSDGESAWTSVYEFTTSMCEVEDQCLITYYLEDSYDDGWEGSVINVVDVATSDILATWTVTESSASGTLSVCNGRDISFEWVNGGGSWDSDASYVVTDLNGTVIFEGSGAMDDDVTYTVDCTIKHTITASTADINGTITPNGENLVVDGENLSFTIVPADDCYHIASVLVDGEEAISNVDENGVYTFANVTADHTIAVSFALNTYEITTSVEGNGTITETSTVNCGDDKQITITPANDCYRIASVMVDGVEAITDVVDGVYTFTNVTADHTIVASFALNTYEITTSVEGNGTITETSTVNCGDDKQITITPANDCYRIASVMVDGVEAITDVVDGVYTFANVTAQHVITARFEQITYSFTVNAGENGTITANDEIGNVANCGEDKSFTIAANEGYSIASVMVDGDVDVTDAVIAADGVYTFENVTADHTIAATFVQVHTISAGTGFGGSITPDGFTTVLDGESQSFTIVPVNECFVISQVMVDGVDVTDEVIANNGVYTFENVTENHNIVANFDAITLTITATAGEGGTITHNSDYENIPCGSNETYTIEANEGYRIASVIVDATEDVTETVIAADGVYTFTNVIADHTINANFAVNNYNLTVHYVYADNTTAAADHTESVAFGAEYSVASPAITGYTADQLTVAGTMPAQDVDVTVTYNINSYTLTIHYVYADDSEAAEDYTATLEYGEPYSVVSPAIDGFTADRLVIEGTMGTADVTETVTYTANPVPTHTLTIHYVYADDSEASEDHVETLAEGATYSVTSPVIDGFTADRLVVEGTMGTADVTETVTYTANPVPTHTLTIHYVYADDSEASEDHVETLAEGATYSVTSPVIDGFTADRLVVEGTMGTADVTETVTYTANPVPTHTLTIHYVYAETNEPAADDYTATLAEGADYSVASPAIDGFTADRLVIEGTMGTEDVTETVTYTANPAQTYTITLTVGEHGTVTATDEDDNEIAIVDGVITVNDDDDLYLVITPEENYQIGELIVDGTPVELEEEDLAGFIFPILGVSSDMAVSVTFVHVSSVEMFEAGSMMVYPNPNNGMFSIDFSNIEGDATYEIINANGAVVETRDINVMNGETMNFNHDLRPGTYFVRIINGDKVYVEQIVVE